jgi:MoaA/NifB/PqqE/SkfB family radical SAM enzyme
VGKVSHTTDKYEFKEGAEEFPLMVVASVTYVCNARCPHCPYTNSDIRVDYADTPFMPEKVFRKIAGECGKYNAFIRLSGGGEPLLHQEMLD